MKTTLSKVIELDGLKNYLDVIVKISGIPHELTVVESRYVLSGKFGCSTECSYKEMNEKLNGIYHCVKYYNKEL